MDKVEIDTDTGLETTVSVVDGDPGADIESMSKDNGIVEGMSSSKEMIRKVGNTLIRLELDLAYASEKLVNMNLLMMHLEARECDFETFASEKEGALGDSAMKALEFDILSGIFDSEVREMDRFIGLLQREINKACQIIDSHKHLGDAFSALGEKLHDAEESMKQSQEQVSELMTQSIKFQRILLSFNKAETLGEDKDVVISEDGDSFDATAKIKLQTSEQQRHFLRMLERSLARELDLEKKLTECTEALDVMKLRLRASKQVIVSMEEQTVAGYARFLEADNASVVLMGTSKELMGQLQLCQLTINSAKRRESELNSRLQNCMQEIQRLEKEGKILQELAEKNSSEALILRDKVNSLQEQLKESESMLATGNASVAEQVKELEEKIVIAESRAEKAEAECNLLAEINKGLHEELDVLKTSGITKEKVDSLEKQLVETNTQLQVAMASVEASQEKQSMLYSSINDMESLIENLKSKVSKADALAESAEDKCIILSEKNAELNEELTFLRGKLECLENSLQQAEETKLTTAKDINVRSQMITDLVMQLAIERERLQQQINLLMKEKRALVNKVRASNKAASNSMNGQGGENDEGVLSPEGRASSVDSGKEKQKEEVSDTTEVEKSVKEVSNGGCAQDSQGPESKLETVRTIEPGWISIKYVVSAIFIAVIAVLVVCHFQPERCPFFTGGEFL